MANNSLGSARVEEKSALSLSLTHTYVYHLKRSIDGNGSSIRSTARNGYDAMLLMETRKLIHTRTHTQSLTH